MHVRGVFENDLYEDTLFMLSLLLRIYMVSSALFAVLTSEFVWLCNNNEEFKYPGSWISETTSVLISLDAVALF